MRAPQVRAFAQALGGLATRDRMEARELAHSAEAGQLLPRALPDTGTQELRALLLRRRQGVERPTAERHRLGTVPLRMHQAMPQPMAWLQWAGAVR